MENKRKLNIIIAITIILTLAFIGIMVKMILENSKCVDNPFKYSAIKLNKSGGNYLCSCKSLDPNLLDFSFNEEGIKIIEHNSMIINLDGGLQ